MQSPIVNNCLKVKIDGYTEPRLVKKHLLQVSVRELHNNLVTVNLELLNINASQLNMEIHHVY